MSLGKPDEKRWIDRMNSFGTKSVLWIEDLTTFKESVLFAHTPPGPILQRARELDALYFAVGLSCFAR